MDCGAPGLVAIVAGRAEQGAYRRAALLGDATTRLVDLGEHRLRDLDGVERLVQLGADGLPDEFPPLRTIDRYPSTLPAQRSSFIGREEERFWSAPERRFDGLTCDSWAGC